MRTKVYAHRGVWLQLILLFLVLLSPFFLFVIVVASALFTTIAVSIPKIPCSD